MSSRTFAMYCADQRLRVRQPFVQLGRRALRRERGTAATWRGARPTARRKPAKASPKTPSSSLGRPEAATVSVELGRRRAPASRSTSATNRPRQIAELLVEDRARHAGLRGDAAERGGVEALGVDDRVGDVENLLAPASALMRRRRLVLVSRHRL